MKTRMTSMAVIMLALVTITVPASAFDPEDTFRKGTVVLSGVASYGWQLDVEDKSNFSDLEFRYAGVRGSVLPLDTLARGTPFYGALEVGLEALYLNYVKPHDQFWSGLGGIVRYHFLSLGRVVPYVEVAGAAGGTDLRLPEIRSTFAFLIFAGAGASVFVTDRAAVYAGYRLQHVSNGNITQPNRGYEASVAVLGLSLFF